MLRAFGLSLVMATGMFAADPPPLTAEVSDTAVAIQNVTPGGDVVLLGVSIESDGGLLREISGALRRNDDDSDGAVTVVPGRKIPFRSIWVVVDIETSRFVIAGPAGYEIDTLPFPDSLTKKMQPASSACSTMNASARRC